ncbi:MAG: endolytic transglycosylase MltG [Oscillospiraceae bacterium]|nr:endolytic transglycosylase MltG [Oscillospiraceae bacterium]
MDNKNTENANDEYLDMIFREYEAKNSAGQSEYDEYTEGAAEGYSSDEYAPQKGYEQSASDMYNSGETDFEYAQQEYVREEYVQGEYAQEEYAPTEYTQGEYAQEEYVQGEYAQGEYAQEEYAQEEYAQTEYVQEEYAHPEAEQTTADNSPEIDFSLDDDEDVKTFVPKSQNSEEAPDDENDLKSNFGQAADNADGYEDRDDEDYDEDDDYDEEDERPVRKKKKGHNPGSIIFALVLTTVIISVSIFAAVFVMRIVQEVTGLDREDIQIVVDIPENTNTGEIAQILLDEGIIGNADMFRFMARFRGEDASFVAGSHLLSPNMTYGDIMEELQVNIEEERQTVDITFPEGITLVEAAELLEENNVCDAERFIYIFNSSQFGFDFEEQVEASAEKFYKMEGFFFPDTYSFYIDEEPEVVAKKVYRNFENRITPDYYGRMKDLRMTLEETITLASMIQAEARGVRDMKNVSSVFHNRLKSRDYPRLESDPTTNYVDEVIRVYIEIADQEMFKAYDTYKGEGLPPGPICNPGIDAIEAALYPTDTEYYYFCADLETGEVFYAATLEEHDQNLIRAHLKEGVLLEDIEGETEGEAEGEAEGESAETEAAAQ